MKNTVVTERFVITYICQKYMTSISNTVNTVNNVNPGTQMNFGE